MDGALLIAVIVVAVTVGKPLSYMNCNVIGAQTGNVDSVYDFNANLGRNLNKVGDRITYYTWLGANKSTCLEMKAIWGLSIALWCVFLALLFRGGERGGVWLTVRCAASCSPSRQSVAFASGGGPRLPRRPSRSKRLECLDGRSMRWKWRENVEVGWGGG